MATRMSSDTPATEPPPRRWKPIEAIERRVLGVLIEKAKTTPENYPLSLNSLRSGCNQKNNRSPLMQLDEDRVEEALERLRHMGAVAQIQGGGRVDKYRHLAYEWLGVEKVELAVMAELLLRGTQTVGELRGRAARMEPIKDLTDLQPTLEALQAKGLILFLSPPGRGAVVTHALYLDRELEKERRNIGLEFPVSPSAPDDETPDGAAAASSAGERSAATWQAARTPQSAPSGAGDVARLAQQLAQLQAELAAVKADLLAARQEFESLTGRLRDEIDELNRQLGN